MKQAVVFQNLVNETNEEFQPVMDEAAAVKMKTEVLRSDTRAGNLCHCHVLTPELHVFYIVLLQCMSVKSSVHNISNCVTVKPLLLIQVHNKHYIPFHGIHVRINADKIIRVWLPQIC